MLVFFPINYQDFLKSYFIQYWAIMYFQEKLPLTDMQIQFIICNNLYKIAFLRKGRNRHVYTITFCRSGLWSSTTGKPLCVSVLSTSMILPTDSFILNTDTGWLMTSLYCEKNKTKLVVYGLRLFNVFYQMLLFTVSILK